MAFGKKKKEKKGKRNQPQAIIKYNKNNNPLYPEKVENDAKAIAMAVGTVVVAIVLVGVIFMNFSYSAHPERLEAKLNGITSGQNNQDVDNQSQDSQGNLTQDNQIGNAVDSEDNSVDMNGVSGTDAEQNNGQSGAVSNTIGIPAEEGQGDGTTEAVDPPENTGDSSYVIEGSDTRYLTKEDVAGLTKEQLRYARNEIYARHGRRFKDQELQQYFDSKSWYQGTIDPDSFNESVLNDCERDNIDLIKKYE